MTRRPFAFLCICCITVIAILTAFGLPPERGYDQKDAVDKLLEIPRDVTVTGEVLRSEEQEDYSYLILKQAVLSVNSNQYKINNVRITLKVPLHYAVGVQISAFGVLKSVPGPVNRGQFDRLFYYRLQDIGYTMSSPAIRVISSRVCLLPEMFALLRESLRNRIQRAFPGDTAGILSAMILGDKSFLSDEIRSAFTMGGISHMLAISGLHISLLGEGIYRFFLLIPFFARGRKKSAGLLALVFLILYAVLSGLSVATVRAVIMFALLRGADLAGRTYDPPTAIAFAALLIVLEQPLYIFYNGFIMSFTAVAVLTAFHDRSRFVLGLILFLTTLPIVLYFYYEFSAYTIFINLIAIPFMPFLLMTGLLGTVFGGSFEYLFSIPAILLMKLVLWLLAVFRKLPFANLIFGRPGIYQVLIYYGVLTVFLYFLDRWRTRKIRFLLFPLVLPITAVLAVHVRSGLSIHFLDIGQGDSCVMEMPGGQNVLIDGGSSTVYDVGTDRIMPFLKYEGIQRLDYVFVTHMDSDHISGVRELLESIRDEETAIRIETLVMPYLKERGETYREVEILGQEAGAEILYVETGDFFRFENGREEESSGRQAVTFRILGPDPSLETSPVDENGQCITFAVNYGNFDCLMTGDVQNDGEDGLIRNLRKIEYTAEVLKVAHHGSKYSTPEELLDILRPDISVISCGRDNWYGHPHAALLRRLIGVNTEILRTDESGEIYIWTDGEEYKWETYI